jgi:hypothetical protein
LGGGRQRGTEHNQAQHQTGTQLSEEFSLHKSFGLSVHTTRRRCARIQFVCHGLCQKCNKKSRNQVFGNWENLFAKQFRQNHFFPVLIFRFCARVDSNLSDIEIDIPKPTLRVGSNNLGLALPD